MKNFQVTAVEDGKKYWISRSVAVHGTLEVCNQETGNNYLLVIKRGQGCPDEIGKWADITGYVDWDETLEEALKREIYEEIGLDLQKVKHVIKLSGVNEFGKKQNITIIYRVLLNYSEIKDLIDKGVINCDTKSRGGEEGEVDEIGLIAITTGKKVVESEFAWNHGKLINKIIEGYDNY